LATDVHLDQKGLFWKLKGLEKDLNEHGRLFRALFVDEIAIRGGKTCKRKDHIVKFDFIKKQKCNSIKTKRDKFKLALGEDVGMECIPWLM